MKINAKQIFMLVLLAILVVYYVLTNFFPGSGTEKISDRKTPVAGETAPSTDTGDAQIGNTSRELVFKKVSFIGDWGDDPFYRRDYVEYLAGGGAGMAEIDENDTSFALTAIIDDWVLIGGEIYMVGNEIKGMKLTEIGEDYVVLMAGNNEVKLILGGNENLED